MRRRLYSPWQDSSIRSRRLPPCRGSCQLPIKPSTRRQRVFSVHRSHLRVIKGPERFVHPEPLEPADPPFNSREPFHFRERFTPSLRYHVTVKATSLDRRTGLENPKRAEGMPLLNLSFCLPRSCFLLSTATKRSTPVIRHG